MELAFLVYFVLFIVLSYWQYLDMRITQTYGKILPSIIKSYPIFVFILIVGFRYNVGGDFSAYNDYYNDQSFISDPSQVDYEYGFYKLIELLLYFDLPAQSLFIVCSFFQVVLLLKIIQISRSSGFLVIFFYFTTLAFIESLNVMRQSIAFLGVILSVYYLTNKKFGLSLLNISIAAIFHGSSLLAIPLIYLLSKSSLHKYSSVIILLIIFSNLYPIEIFSMFIDIAANFPFIGGYSGYLVLSKELFIENINSGISIGLILSLSTDIYLVRRSREFIDYGGRSLSSVVFNSYLVGCLIYPIVAATGFLALGRGMMYFYGMKFIIISTVLYRGYKNGNIIERNGLLIFPIALLYFLWFCVAVYIGAAGSSPYNSYLGFMF